MNIQERLDRLEKIEEAWNATIKLSNSIGFPCYSDKFFQQFNNIKEKLNKDLLLTNANYSIQWCIDEWRRCDFLSEEDYNRLCFQLESLNKKSLVADIYENEATAWKNLVSLVNNCRNKSENLQLNQNDIEEIINFILDQQNNLKKKKPQVQRALDVITEILRLGGELSENELHGAFYRAHIEYAKQDPGFLTGYPIIRKPHGPAIYNFDLLKVHFNYNSNFDTYSLSDTKYETGLSGIALDAIRKSVKWVEDSKLNNKLNYDNSWSWLEGKNDELLDIYVDLETKEEYEKNKKLYEECLKDAEKIFKELENNKNV